jgi:hypothetical protein
VIPVAFPRLSIDRLRVGVEALAAGRRRFQHPSGADGIALVELNVSAAKIVIGPD